MQIAKITPKKEEELSIGELRNFEVLSVGNLDHPFLMMEEPFSMIDPLYKIEINKFLNQLKLNKGILITDHHYNDVLKITSKNLLLKDRKSHIIKTIDDLIPHNYLRKHSA